MRIGELSARTGTSRRLLRYYEEQQLIASERCANGYRNYDERFVDRVLQIRGLLDAGLPTRIIKQILPCLDKPRVIHFPDATPEMLATLERELDRMTERINCLVRNRDAVAEYLAAVRVNRRDAPRETPTREATDRLAADRAVARQNLQVDLSDEEFDSAPDVYGNLLRLAEEKAQGRRARDSGV